MSDLEPALYQCAMEDGTIEHFSGCFGKVLESNGIRVLEHTPLYGEDVVRALQAELIKAKDAALEDLLADFDALDSARHLMQWMDMGSRPTERSLQDHCKRLGRTAPAECRDVDHVPPKALRTFWILREIVAAHRSRHLQHKEREA